MSGWDSVRLDWSRGERECLAFYASGYLDTGWLSLWAGYVVDSLYVER